MEGYFVRTLGMHRVYNSAFMNMLRDEKNLEYRKVLKNTLEFDPEILKRYVNFMNNPDERTAVDQFGKGDKYFGVCIMLATMPGLPMIGHGQVEGFTEKYGMEYKQAYWEEQPDRDLIARHEREIFPLLRKRYIFSGVGNFLLFDFFSTDGYVNEDVYAYSNWEAGESALVIYHNKYAEASGWIKTSAAYSVKSQESSDSRIFVRKDLSEGLGLSNKPKYFTILKDQISGLQYIRKNKELIDKGLFVQIAAYQCIVFMDIYQVEDNDKNQYAQLESYLNGRGVPDIEQTLVEIIMQPIRNHYRELVNPGLFNWLIQNVYYDKPVISPNFDKAIDEVRSKSENLFLEVGRFLHRFDDISSITDEITSEIEVALLIQRILLIIYNSSAGMDTPEYIYLISKFSRSDDSEEKHSLIFPIIFAWIFTYHLGEILYPNEEDKDSASELSRTWMDEWLLNKLIFDTFLAMGFDDRSAVENLSLIKILTNQSGWVGRFESDSESAKKILEGWLQDPDIQAFIQVNRYQEKLWFNKESFELLIWWLYLVGVIRILNCELRGEDVRNSVSPELMEPILLRVSRCYRFIEIILDAEIQSDFQVGKLLEGLEK
jgi:hypothetical protein